MNGIINLYKPSQITSHDAVKIVRRKFRKIKVGHTGTLDPMAIGVLPICLGKATRITEYLTNSDKSYKCEMTLGIQTDTQDIWGKIQSQQEGIKIDEDKAIQIFKQYTGELNQTPPMYSAVKVQGKRLYQYARDGEEVEIKPRKIKIYELNPIDFNKNRITFDVKCSKGTYIRTLCHDIGNELGCGAVMSYLERTSSGIFTKKNAITIKELENLPPDEYIIPMDVPLKDMGAVYITEEKGYKMALNGCTLTGEDYEWGSEDKALTKVYYKNTFIAIGKYNDIDRTIAMKKVFM